MSVVELLRHERDFKQLCDGLLKFEIGPLVQTYAASGADKGVDAEFTGDFGGVRGRWVFQYKFMLPSEALSIRRSRLRALYCSARGKSEFDREGVVNADGYVLLTNVPVSVGLVQKLHEQWRSRSGRRKGRPFAVWDPSRLNVLLNGREHLARSWTGVKEARCKQSIVLPLWNWLERAKRHVLEPAASPLWPAAVVQSHRPIPSGIFSTPTEAAYCLALTTDDAELRLATTNPLWRHASVVAYREAFRPFPAVVEAFKTLDTTLRREIDGAQATILARVPRVSNLAEQERANLVLALAYALLEIRWGLPNDSAHMIRDTTFTFKGVYTFGCPEGIQGDLDALVNEVPHGQVPKAVLAARRTFAETVALWWRRLWYVVELGIDAEPE